MVRILGTNIPEEKKVFIALTYVYGVGPHRSDKILAATKISPDKKAKELSADEVKKIQEFVEKNYKIEGDLRREKQSHIKRMKDIGCYKGTRHQKRLPVRGQRTKTNSRTIRGNVRKQAASGKRKLTLK